MNLLHRITLAVLFLMGPLSFSAETSDQWIAKARAFLGGDSALNAVKSIHFTGTLEIESESKLQTDIVFQKSFQQRITVIGPEVIVTTALDGYDAWQRRTNAVNPSQWQITLLDAPQIKRLRANTLENLSFYASHEMKGCLVKLIGEVSVDGLACAKLSFTHSGNVNFLRYFDKSTGRLIKTETENGGEIREEGEMFVNGVRFPRRVINTSPSGKTTTISFATVTVNEVFPAEEFQVPSLQAK